MKGWRYKDVQGHKNLFHLMCWLLTSVLNKINWTFLESSSQMRSRWGEDTYADIYQL